MDTKRAVDIAKSYVAELFFGEGVYNLGLEEVEFDSTRSEWRVTVGFSREWDGRGSLAELTGIPRARSYKVVRLNADGQVLAMTNQKSTG